VEETIYLGVTRSIFVLIQLNHNQRNMLTIFKNHLVLSNNNNHHHISYIQVVWQYNIQNTLQALALQVYTFMIFYYHTYA